jgi:O-antigen/teichoic acid export membrane protein
MKKGLLLFILLSIGASALNYIVYPIFSRILPSSEYISITTALSLFTQASTFLSSILAITIGLSKRRSQTHNTDETIEVLQSFLFKLFGVVAVLFLLFSPAIMALIHTPTLFALPICIMMVLSIPILIISGYLNGKNLMIKLGLVTLLAASSQFIIGLLTAYLSRNGLATMFAMSLAQIITLVIIYSAFTKDNLPGIKKSLGTAVRIKDARTRNLLIFTALTSFAIMAVSLAQIADLFIVQGLHNADVKFYTDLYVISRVVFFAGMIFIWPFLGETSLEHHHNNRLPFLRVIGYFTAISITAILLIFFAGDHISTLLFGSHYSLASIQTIGILSVTYKFLLLIITAVVLYFVVLRSYLALVTAFVASGSIFLYAQLFGHYQSILELLIGLNSIAALVAISGCILLFKTPIKSESY